MELPRTTPATSRPTARTASGPAGPATGSCSCRPRRSSTTSPGSPPSGCATSPPTSGPTAPSPTSAPSTPRRGPGEPDRLPQRLGRLGRRRGASCRGSCTARTATCRSSTSCGRRWSRWLDRAERIGPRAAAPRPGGAPAGAGAARAVPLGHRLPLGRVARARRGPRADFGAFVGRRQGRRRDRLLRAQRRPDGRGSPRCSAATDDAARYAELARDVRARLAGRVPRRRRPAHARTRRPTTCAPSPSTWCPTTCGAAVADRLVELIREAGTHLGTGFLATPYLLPVLADTGHLDVAYELLLQDTEPSWLVMIDRGATTIWEHWNGVDADGVPARVAQPLQQGRGHLVPAPVRRRHRAGRARLPALPGRARGPAAGSPRPRRRTSRRTAGSSPPGGSRTACCDLRVVVPAGTEARSSCPTAPPTPPHPASTRTRPPWRTRSDRRDHRVGRADPVPPADRADPPGRRRAALLRRHLRRRVRLPAAAARPVGAGDRDAGAAGRLDPRRRLHVR